MLKTVLTTNTWLPTSMFLGGGNEEKVLKQLAAGALAPSATSRAVAAAEHSASRLRGRPPGCLHASQAPVPSSPGRNFDSST